MDFNIAVAFWFAGRGEGRTLDSDNMEREGKECQAESSRLLRFSNVGKPININGASGIRPICIRRGCTRFADQCIFQACKSCCGKLQGPISAFLGKRANICRVHNQLSVETTKESELKVRASQCHFLATDTHLLKSGANSLNSFRVACCKVQSRHGSLGLSLRILRRHFPARV